MRYDVVGLGNALLDFQVEAPYEFLSELNVTKGSMTLVETAFQSKAIALIHDRFHRNIQKSSGGCSANTLAGLASFGGKGYFFGKVGKDAAGRHYREDLEKIGITTSLAEDSQDATGTCLALITPDAERTMLTHLGIATQLNEKDISADPIQNSSITYIEGYLWDSPTARKASLKAMELAKASGRLVAFTYSDSFCVDRHLKDFLELAKSKVDILFCNESEAMKATGLSNPEDAFRVMKDWCKVVCTTLGPRGAALSDSRSKQTESISTWDVKLVDKMGAGDLFAAGVLFGLSTGRDLRECGFLGCYAATRVIQQMGARLPQSLKPDIPLALRGPETPALAV